MTTTQYSARTPEYQDQNLSRSQQNVQQKRAELQAKLRARKKAKAKAGRPECTDLVPLRSLKYAKSKRQRQRATVHDYAKRPYVPVNVQARCQIVESFGIDAERIAGLKHVSETIASSECTSNHGFGIERLLDMWSSRQSIVLRTSEDSGKRNDVVPEAYQSLGNGMWEAPDEESVLDHDFDAKRRARPKRRRAKKTAQTELIRSSTDPFLHGVKRNGEPQPCINKDNFIANWNLRKPFPKLANYQLQDHFNGTGPVLYFMGAGSKKTALTLAMIDVDCHKCGTLAGATAFARYLQERFPGLHYESSTNGTGIHGYLLVEKIGVKAQHVNLALRRLEKFLRHHAIGYDIELVEIKGHCPEFTFGEDGRLEQVKYGSLAKIPRSLHSTCVIQWDDLMSERFDVPDVVPSSSGGCRSAPPSSSGKSSGSNPWKLDISKYPRLAQRLQYQCNKAGRWAVTVLDWQVFLAILKFICDRQQPDGSIPRARIKGLWNKQFADGTVDRPYNKERVRAMFNTLSRLGWIRWLDNSYAPGKACCKWEVEPGLWVMESTVTDTTPTSPGYLRNTEFPQGPGKFLLPVLRNSQTAMWRDLKRLDEFFSTAA